MQSNNANEVLDSLLQELASGGLFNNLPLIMRSTRSGSSASSSNGPIIAEVTDELDQLSTENLQQQSGTQPMAYAHEVQVTEPTSFNDYMGTAYTATGVRNVPSPRQRRQPSGKGSRHPQQAQQQFVYSAQVCLICHTYLTKKVSSIQESDFRSFIILFIFQKYTIHTLTYEFTKTNANS